jgi:hypothetical protein
MVVKQTQVDAGVMRDAQKSYEAGQAQLTRQHQQQVQLLLADSRKTIESEKKEREVERREERARFQAELEAEKARSQVALERQREMFKTEAEAQREHQQRQLGELEERLRHQTDEEKTNAERCRFLYFLLTLVS